MTTTRVLNTVPRRPGSPTLAPQSMAVLTTRVLRQVPAHFDRPDETTDTSDMTILKNSSTRHLPAIAGTPGQRTAS